MNWVSHCGKIESRSGRNDLKREAKSALSAGVRKAGAWVVVHMARSADKAHQMEAALQAEGVLVRLKPVYKNRNDQDNYFEILVLHSELDAAREIFLEKGF